MSRDASGNFTLAPGNPVQAGTIIDPNWANPTLSDIANNITDSLSRTGRGGMQAPLSVGTQRITDLAPATLGSDAATAFQVQSSAFSWLFPAESDATGNAYTGTSLLADAPVAGSVFFFLVDKVNTGAVTLRINGGAVLPVGVNGVVLTAGQLLPGTIVEVVFFSNTYRIIGGVGGSGSGGGVNSVLSTNPSAVGISLSGSLITISPNTNQANGILQLDSSGAIPVAYVPLLATSYIGQFNATPGANPANGTAQGQFYIISNPGTLSLFRLSAGQNYTQQSTSVISSDTIIWNQINTGAQPTGWYFVSTSATPTAGTNVSITPTSLFPTATNAQTWDNAADAYLVALDNATGYLRKTGGTITGPIIYGAIPATAGTLANKQYVDDKFATIPPNVASFNTRIGAVSLLPADVTGALGYTPANLAGADFTGPISTTGSVVAKQYVQLQYVANILGTTTLDFTNGQSQILTSTGSSSILAVNGLTVGDILRVVFIATNLGPVSWPVLVKWPNGIAPDLTTGALKRAIVVFENDGTNILANAAVY